MKRPHLIVTAVQPLHLSIRLGDGGDRDFPPLLTFTMARKNPKRRRSDAYRSKSSFPIRKVRLGRETTVCAELQILSGADRRWDLVAAQHSTARHGYSTIGGRTIYGRTFRVEKD
jgi:hypothetical protein